MLIDEIKLESQFQNRLGRRPLHRASPKTLAPFRVSGREPVNLGAELLSFFELISDLYSIQIIYSKRKNLILLE